jgi:hypothetical protein
MTPVADRAKRLTVRTALTRAGEVAVEVGHAGPTVADARSPLAPTGAQEASVNRAPEGLAAT